MATSSMRQGEMLAARAREIDWGAVAAWSVGFGLVAYLGLKGGGYDALVHDAVGIGVLWVLLLGVVVGALPRGGSPGRLGLAALGLFAAFTAWSALSLVWTESVENTWADLARVAGYLGIFALALLARGRDGAPRIVAGVATAIVLVAGVALLSRLHPGWFPESGQTAVFISDSLERLSYPINYWNGLGALIAIGMPLLLHSAASARTLAMRGLAAAALPALTLTAFYTLSRGGIAAAGLALAVYLALAPDRLPKLLALGCGGAGGAVLVWAANGRDALREGLTGPLAADQGDEMMLLALVVCAAVGLAVAGLGYLLDRELRPAWTEPSRRGAQAALAVGALVAIVAALALDAPGRVSDGWDEFREGGGPGTGTERLGSVAGQSRYEFWQSAVDQNASKPLTGTGSGSFEFWWARNGTTDESVRDTHSLYMQTLGELGIVGLALLAAFLAAILVGGGIAAARLAGAERSALAAAVAGCVAFCATALVDWMWQIPVLAVAFLLLAAAAIGARGERRGSFAVPARAGLAIAALVGIVVIAVPLAATEALRASEAEARSGNLTAALADARGAENVQPGAAGPRLQEALVLEEMGDMPGAVAAARAAADREPTNWRVWLVLSRVEAQAGETAAAVRDYRRARSLNPRSPLFAR